MKQDKIIIITVMILEAILGFTGILIGHKILMTYAILANTLIIGLYIFFNNEEQQKKYHEKIIQTIKEELEK